MSVKRWGLARSGCGLACAAAIAAAGCGGGNTADGVPTRVLNARLEFSGHATSQRVSQITSAPSVGDGQNLVSVRALVRFDLREIPVTANVTQARLRVFQLGANGDPYGQFGDMTVDHVFLGAALDGSD